MKTPKCKICGKVENHCEHIPNTYLWKHNYVPVPKDFGGNSRDATIRVKNSTPTSHQKGEKGTPTLSGKQDKYKTSEEISFIWKRYNDFDKGSLWIAKEEHELEIIKLQERIADLIHLEVQNKVLKKEIEAYKSAIEKVLKCNKCSIQHIEEVAELKEQLKEFEDIYLKDDDELAQENIKLKKEIKAYKPAIEKGLTCLWGANSNRYCKKGSECWKCQSRRQIYRELKKAR